MKSAARPFRAALLLAILLTLLGAGAPVEVETPATRPRHDAGVSTNPLDSLPSGSVVAVIRIEGFIYDFTLESLKSRVDRAVKGGASLIVIEIDTNGGELPAATDISRYIKTIPVMTLAWVNSKAYSAGILIASSCNGIIMGPSAVMGDCAPITLTHSLAPTERAKVLSPLLAEFRDNAERAQYDYTLFHAMCELGVEVNEIEHTETGERRFVNQADYQVLVQGMAPDVVRAAGRAAGWAQALPPATTAPASQPSSAGPLVPPRGAELGGGGFMPEEHAPEFERGSWKLVQQVHDGKSLLTVHETRARGLGLSRGVVKDDADLKRFLNAASVTRIHLPAVEAVAYWLTRPWIRGILVMALMIGSFIELKTPGLGVGGAVAVLALLLLLIGPYLVGLAQMWQIVLVIAGFMLLMIEVFVVPGTAIVGIIGVICMFIGLALAAVPSQNGMPVAGSARALQESLLWMFIGVVFSLIAFYYITKYFGHLPVVNRLVLRNPGAGPALVGPGAMTVSGDEVLGVGRVKVGDVGQAASHLRPSGRAEIGGLMVDVMTNGTWVEPGAPVRVVEVMGNRIVVEPKT